MMSSSRPSRLARRAIWLQPTIFSISSSCVAGGGTNTQRSRRSAPRNTVIGVPSRLAAMVPSTTITKAAGLEQRDQAAAFDQMAADDRDQRERDAGETEDVHGRRGSRVAQRAGAQPRDGLRVDSDRRATR